MNFRLGLLISSILFVATLGITQVNNIEVRKNIVHLEAGGIGGYGSLNYERILPLNALFSLSGRIGFSTIRVYDFKSQFNPDLVFPIAINGFFGREHKIQIGFGQVVANIISVNIKDGKPDRNTNLHSHFAIGYRYQRENGRLILGISYTPILEFQTTYRHWGSAMIGYSF